VASKSFKDIEFLAMAVQGQPVICIFIDLLDFGDEPTAHPAFLEKKSSIGLSNNVCPYQLLKTAIVCKKKYSR